MATCWMLRLDPGSKCWRNRMGALCTIDWFVSVIETSREICTNHAFLRLWDWSSSAQFCHWGKEVKMRAKPSKRWFNQWLMVAEHDVRVVACKWYDIDNTIQYTMVRWRHFGQELERIYFANVCNICIHMLQFTGCQARIVWSWNLLHSTVCSKSTDLPL